MNPPATASTPPAGGAPPPASRWGCQRGCTVAILAPLAVLLLVVAIFGGRYAWGRYRQAKADALARQAQLERFDATLEKLTPSQQEYDLDQTIRVMHSIDLALRQQPGDLDAFCQRVQAADTTYVAPRLLAARRQFLAQLRELYARQRDLAQRQHAWTFASELLLTTLSVVNLNLSPIDFSVGTDRKQAQQSLAELKTRYREKKALSAEVEKLSEELFAATLAYTETYYHYLAEWDKLCLLRDRAYLAAAQGQWAACAEAARKAIAMAPRESEAHLLLARALIEQGGAEGRAEAGRLLGQYLEQHPDRSAPALLLLGVLAQSANPAAEAALPLQQAAAYYPRQADTLTDMLDPYQMRAFLRKSREGNYILQHYRSTMLGAGYFSPDLQLATQAFARGDRATAETKLFDHFYRRRLQQQWDFILADIEYCYQHLGTPFLQVFPESSYLDLVANPTTFGKKLALAVRNRSDRDLHNASLVLCLHLTDMLPGDYVALQAGPTLPLLKANAVTPVGELQIAVPFNGTTKAIQDIVATRAILVAQEVVTWVDTPQYRLAELQQQRQHEGARAALPSLDVPWLTQLRQHPGQFAQGLLKEVQLRPLDKRWGKDGVEIVLPRELALLRPFFRLAVNGQQLEPKENVMADNAIRLTFDDVAELTGQPPERLKLLLQSPFTDVALEWLLGQDRQYRLEQVQVPESGAAPR